MENKLTEIPFEDAEYSVFDFRLRNFCLHDKVMRSGSLKLNGRLRYIFLIHQSGKTRSIYITQMTGITTTDVQDAPYFDEVYLQIKEFIGDTILTAHNLSFDYSFLKHECLNQELEVPDNAICTVDLL